jgi:hypothetical protein
LAYPNANDNNFADKKAGDIIYRAQFNHYTSGMGCNHNIRQLFVVHVF